MIETQLTYHFSYKEFMCKCGKCDGKIPEKYEYYLHKLVNALQTIRFQLGKAIIILSGYRCSKHPETIKRPRSYHAWAAAADIRPATGGTIYLAQLAERHPFIGGIGYYPEEEFIHVDIRERPARWVKLKDRYIDLISDKQFIKNHLFVNEQMVVRNINT